jgi:hypothetical protein
MSVAGLGLIVVLLCWPVCRFLPRVVAVVVSAVIGLVTPAVVVFMWAWLVPDSMVNSIDDKALCRSIQIAKPIFSLSLGAKPGWLPLPAGNRSPAAGPRACRR